MVARSSIGTRAPRPTGPGRGSWLRGVVQAAVAVVAAIGVVVVAPNPPAVGATTPTLAWQNTGVTAVAVGNAHTCAIQNGVLFCWGAGTQGQLGYQPPPRPPVLPSPTDQAKAMRVTPSSGFQNNGNVTTVSAGSNRTCAIESGILYCWGANGQGQVGNGRNTQQNTPAKVTAANGFDNNGNVTAVSTGDLITCAIESGEVFCWGANGMGGVGDGTTTHRNVPQKVLNGSGFVNNGGATDVGTGMTSCAIKAGIVYCWGAANAGQLGNGSTTPSYSGTPVRVSTVNGGFQNSGAVTSVTSGGSTVCAVESSAMYCWGTNGYGNGGVGVQVANQTTARRVSTVADGMTNQSVTSHRVGYASCAVDAGIVYCFGVNWTGQVGDGTTTQRLSPTKVSAGGGMANAGQVTAVSTFESHACAIERGSVFCWGDATNGRLGNGETTGTFSTPVSAASLPGAPVISGATVGTDVANVTLTPGPGGVPTSYTVTASATDDPTDVTTCTVTAPATSCQIQGLREGTTYSFVATARSDQGTSQPSTPVTRATGRAATPGAPNVIAGNNQLQVTVDPTTSGGTPTGYIVTASPDGATCMILSPALSCILTPAVNGTPYNVTTTAFNDAGESDPSDGTTVTAGPAAQPQQPSIGIGDGSATVSVSPTTSGGTPVGYIVTATTSGGAFHTCTVTPPDTSCTLTGLTNGTVYTFTTTATNGAGPSAPSDPVAALVDIVPIPAPPTVEIRSDGVTVSVSRMPNGGTPQRYDVTLIDATTGATVSAMTCTVVAPSTGCQFDFPGLTQPSSYIVLVEAVNDVGSATASAQFLYDQPGPPDFDVQSIGLSSVTVSVSPTTSGGPPSSYVVYAGNGSCTVTVPTTSCTITGLDPAQSPFTVTASATNALGTATNSSGTQVVLGPPGAPDGPPTVVVGFGSATISVAPVTTGGVPSLFIVTASAVGDPTDVATCTYSPPDTGCSITGLTNGVVYDFTTAAVNDFGASPTGDVTTKLVDALPIPLTPTTVVGNGGVTVSVSSSPSGGTVDSYEVHLEPGGLTCTVFPPTTSSCFIPLPTNGLYTVTTTATNGIGTSDPSPSHGFRFEAPAPPLVQSVVIGLGQVTVSVAPGGTATAAAVTSFTVYAGGQTCTVTPPATSCSISGLTGGQTYTVTASATNGVGTTPSTAGLEARLIPPNPPGAPLVFLESSTSAKVYVAPPDGGEVPSSYTVTATSSAGVTRTCTVVTPEIDCDLTGLTDGQLYYFSVTASNAYGPSEPGPQTAALLAAPATPLAPRVSPADGRATVNVLPGTGGGPASVYIVNVEPGGLTCDGGNPIVPPADSCLISGLTNGVEYTFTVIAANGVGSSTSSAGTTATPRPLSPPPAAAVTAAPDRMGGADRFGTAVAVSQQFGVPSAPAVYMASGAVFADALVAGSYAASDGGSVLLAERDRVSPEVLTELRRLVPDEVVIVGGYDAVSLAVEQAIAALGIPVRRVAGADRFATATALSRDEFPNGALTVFIASGLGFADALPAGVIASLADGPVLLVRPDSIPAETAAELARLRPQRIVLVGGVNAVGAEVEAALAAFSADVVRIGGADRYATSVALSQSRFVPGVPVVFLASGEEFADALSAVAPAGRLGGPVLLTRSTCVPASVLGELSRLRPGRVVTLGGTAALDIAIDRLSPC